jgi:hypothetical protein
MLPLPGRRGTRRSLWKRAAAGLDEVKQDAAAAPPGRRGTRSTGATKIHCGGGARSGPRGVREITPPPLMAGE